MYILLGNNRFAFNIFFVLSLMSHIWYYNDLFKEESVLGMVISFELGSHVIYG